MRFEAPAPCALPRVALLPLAAFTCLAGVLVTGSCATTPSGTSEPETPGETVEVKPGQTVFDLSRDSGLSVEEILEVNGLASADAVAPGDRLFLPAGRARRTPPREEPSVPEREEPAHTSSSDLAWPIDGVVLRAFSASKARGGPYEGILIAAPAGSRVHAAADGRIAFAGEQGTAYGRFVIVEHAGDLVTVYAHLEDLLVTEGARVKRGDVVGTVGTSGAQQTPRLHFQVRRGRTAVDPEPLLPE
jgi:murein DD-endopeptidase MepM/ murein hydrolase activator NlpD